MKRGLILSTALSIAVLAGSAIAQPFPKQITAKAQLSVEEGCGTSSGSCYRGTIHGQCIVIDTGIFVNPQRYADAWLGNCNTSNPPNLAVQLAKQPLTVVDTMNTMNIGANMEALNYSNSCQVGQLQLVFGNEQAPYVYMTGFQFSAGQCVNTSGE